MVGRGAVASTAVWLLFVANSVFGVYVAHSVKHL